MWIQKLAKHLSHSYITCGIACVGMGCLAYALAVAMGCEYLSVIAVVPAVIGTHHMFDLD